MSKKLAGKKFSGRHSTIIDTAYKIVRFFEKNERVDKIVLGQIRQCRASSSKRSIKIKETSSGLQLIIRGNMYAQRLFIYLKNPTSDREAITRILVE